MRRFLTARAFVLVAALAACGGDDAVPPVDSGTDAGRDASAVCTMAADCLNAMHCDGAETCAPGTTSADARGCVAGTPPCASGETCDEVMDMCLPCSGDDADEDGWSGCDDDCDDGDAMRYPGATELCDGDDEDCNDTTRGDNDLDHDGFISATCCNGTDNCEDDCDDTNRGVAPMQDERFCDGRDDNCNGATDEGFPTDVFVDDDGDGFGCTPVAACSVGSTVPIATVGGDCAPICDDADPNRAPGATEYCDGIDNDCDGLIDEGASGIEWYVDSDGDGFGDPTSTPVVSCVSVTGRSPRPTDCEDTDATRSPASPELCNARDDDCNEATTYVIAIGNTEDNDGDGAPDPACPGADPAVADCNDDSADAHPGATEICNGEDDDCDGMIDETMADRAWYPDADGDGWGDASAAPVLSCIVVPGRIPRGGDCDDADPARSPARRESCNGVDDDCDGTVDEGVATILSWPDADLDGWGEGAPTAGCGPALPAGRVARGGDCDGADAARNPGAAETCNGVDDECDGAIDNGVPAGAACTAGIGACTRSGTLSCVGGTYSSCGAVAAAPNSESCNGVDDDCDALTDEVCLAIGAGEQHTCAVLPSGSVYCWGYNGHGQLGDGTTTARLTPVRVVGIDDAVEVAGQEYSTCARRRSGAVSCWGRNNGGQLGRGTSTPFEVAPGDVVGVSDAVSIDSTSGNFACARRASGSVVCWGGNNLGQCGTGSVGGAVTTPTNVGLLAEVVDLAVGRTHSCARVASGEVSCWGDLGIGGCGWGCSSGASGVPVGVPGLSASLRLAAAGWHACAGLSDGTVRCWGRNLYGELGDGTTTENRAPVVVSGLVDVSLVDAGGHDWAAHSCAVTAGGAIRCWGDNTWGQLGNGTTSRAITPITVTGLPTPIRSSALSAGHSCATDGLRVWCWGRNLEGQLGDGTTVSRGLPRAVVDLPRCEGADCDVVAMSGSNWNTCAVRRNGTVVCLGENNYGQFGSGDTAPASIPTEAANLTGVVDVASGGRFTCAHLASGTVMCWGSNSAGQLGDGTTIDRLLPTAVAGLTNVVQIAVEQNVGGGTVAGHACARVSTGGNTLYCWGDNTGGQLGLGATSPGSRTPQLVPGLTGVVDVALGRDWTCALLEAGTVYCWGNLAPGAVMTTSPTLIVGLPAASQIDAGNDTACALLRDRTVSCWGDGTRGQIGDGSRVSRAAGTRVSGLTDAVEVRGAYKSFCARRAMGAVVCWGENGAGELGDGVTHSLCEVSDCSAIPVAVSGLSDAIDLAAGGAQVCARRASGPPVCWGDNRFGQIGLAPTVIRTPRPIGGL